MKNILNWLKERMSEKSTWLEVLTFLSTVFGMSIKPEIAIEIATIGVAIASLIGVATKEKK